MCVLFKTDILFLVTALVAFCQSVSINEMMIDPVYSENSGEYVEIYNSGGTAVNLAQWCFGDASDMDVLVFFEDSLLHAGSYGLILDSDYAGEYDDLIPDSVLRITIGDSRFGAYGLSNSTQKFYFLQNGKGIRVDSCLSMTDCPEGYSMEKDDEGAWHTSKQEGGTPGFANSVCAPDYPQLVVSFGKKFFNDLLVTSILTIINTGRQPAEIWEISLRDSLTGGFLGCFSGTDVIPAGDSINISVTWKAPLYGISKIYWTCGTGVYEYSGIGMVTVPLPVDSLHITEFCPIPADGISCEYIEFYNASSHPVNIAGTTISDKTGTARLTNEDYLLPELGLRVAAERPDLRQDMQSPPFFLWVPPEWRSLNNNGDHVVWKDPEGWVIDSLAYTSAWGFQNGAGLERRFIFRPAYRKDNWVPGFSPGLPNLDTLEDKAWKGELTLKKRRENDLTL